METITERYFTMPEALALLASEPCEDALSDEQSDYRTEWTLTRCLNDAVMLAKNGDKDLLVKLIAESERLNVANQGLSEAVLDTAYDTTGHTVDIGRYLEGEPDCMIETIITASSRVLNLVVNCGACWKIEAKDLLRRLSIVASVVKSLENAGYSVGIVYQFAAKSYEHPKSDKKHIFYITIKEPDKYADWSVVAFWIVHPSALRRCLFKIAECEPKKVRNYYGFNSKSCYGIPVNHKPSFDCVYIPCMERSETYMSDDELKRCISSLFANQNILIN